MCDTASVLIITLGVLGVVAITAFCRLNSSHLIAARAALSQTDKGEG